MIKLSEEYYIGFQPLNIILYKTRITGEKSKNPGTIAFDEIGYYGKIEHLIESLLNDKVKHSEYNSLQELKDDINSFKKEILDTIKSDGICKDI